MYVRWYLAPPATVAMTDSQSICCTCSQSGCQSIYPLIQGGIIQIKYHQLRVLVLHIYVKLPLYQITNQPPH